MPSAHAADDDPGRIEFDMTQDEQAVEKLFSTAW
jgi:hypothetical protein